MERDGFTGQVIRKDNTCGCDMLESVNEGDEWSMEVDLRSREKEKRTLHWFVREKQQKGFINGLSEKVTFMV